MTKPIEAELPQLVVMLTYNDFTIENAEDIFEQCKDSDAVYWGMKEKPLPPERMKALFARMKECGKTTLLEVVAYSEEEGLRGAGIAVECGCDILMGTKFFPSIAEVCKKHGIRYMPFAGNIEGRPSVLTGSIDEIVNEAKEVMDKGADGVDLLGYRYTGDAVALNKALSRSIPAKVCIAGSIDSYKRLDEIKDASPALFTIGSAFFNNRFDGSICEQINKVCSYIGAPAGGLD